MTIGYVGDNGTENGNYYIIIVCIYGGWTKLCITLGYHGATTPTVYLDWVTMSRNWKQPKVHGFLFARSCLGEKGERGWE